MSRNAPHNRHAMEGYYNKFDFEDGSHIVVIISSVRTAEEHKRPHMLSFTYHPPGDQHVWQRQCYDRTIVMRAFQTKQGFELRVPGVGTVKFFPDGTALYDLDFNDFTFRARVEDSIMWSGQRDSPGRESSPEGWLSWLPLPLHWHVSSIRSTGICNLSVLNDAVPTSMERSSTAYVHQEKNWGNSFPKSHMWIQARDGARSICLAGGAVVLGVKAFLVGYRSVDLDLDFKPPFAMQLLGLSPFVSSRSDWRSRTFELDVSSFTHRLVLTAKAPHDSFFTLGAPFAEGHREDALAQSFRACLDIVIYHRSFVSPRWLEVRRDAFVNASLEFGGAYFGGLDKKAV